MTQADRDRWLETVRERGDPLRTLEQIIATAGATHPVIADLTVDDRGRLWMQRNVSQDQPVIYDIFERDGTYAGSISPSFRPTPYIPIRIRGDRMYAVVRDSMDVPSVVRAPLPVPAR